MKSKSKRYYDPAPPETAAEKPTPPPAPPTPESKTMKKTEAPQTIDEKAVIELEVHPGALLSRLTPLFHQSGVAYFSAADVRALLDAGLLMQTR